MFQSLLLTGAVVLLISTPATSKEVPKDGIGESFTQAVGKSRLDQKVAVKDKEFAMPALGIVSSGKCREIR
ncbi:hypothetical protein [Nostoc sp.]|uniref:hypothetical protein n=1 Tax=Nostoc sp. TaxID=1180 RepID=UPI002FF7E36E